jgi:rod shape-determining protein MreC
MKNLILFFQKYYHLFLLGLLEIVAFYSVIQFNTYHKSWMFNTTSAASAEVLGIKNEFNYYFNLGTENQRLSLENQQLRERLSEQIGIADSLVLEKDTLGAPVYAYIPAVIISKTINKARNYFLLNKGRNSGITPNMGVITQDGIVGVIVQSSSNVSQVMTVLHPDFRLTPLIGEDDQSGFVNWDGKDVKVVTVNRINKHRDIIKGDSIFTSSFSANFPAGVPVAVVDDISSDQKSSFFKIKANLTTDFANVRSVFIVKHIYKTEIDSLSNEN